VNEERVPSEVRQEWSTRTGTWAEWVTAFQTVDNVDNAAATAENIKEETFLLKKVEMFRTPLKKRKEKDKEWEGRACVRRICKPCQSTILHIWKS
jgi:hypothetical protein